jgi:hypothetical protein
MLVAASVVVVAAVAARLARDQGSFGEGCKRRTGIARRSGHDFDTVSAEAVDRTSSDATHQDRADAELGHETGHAAPLAVARGRYDLRGHDGFAG